MSLMDEFKKIIHPYDDEDDDYEEDVGRDSEPTYFEPREPRESSRRKEVPAEERRNKVVNIHATTQLKVACSLRIVEDDFIRPCCDLNVLRLCIYGISVDRLRSLAYLFSECLIFYYLFFMQLDICILLQIFHCIT